MERIGGEVEAGGEVDRGGRGYALLCFVSFGLFFGIYRRTYFQ